MQRNTAVKILISITSLLIIALMYILSGRDTDEPSMGDSALTDNVSDAFVFEPETLTYDGSGEMDFLEGVFLEGYTADELEDMVYIRVTAGNILSEKYVEYTADTDEGRVRSTRRLLLENYNGPKIQIPDKMPTVTMSNIDQLADLLSEVKNYKVDDGFGNDMRAYVQIAAERSTTNSSIVNYTFTLDNAYGDRAVAQADVHVSDVPAVIVLTAASTTIRVGGFLDPYEFIQSATTMDGSSVIEEVHCSEIDTSEPGEYRITYELRGQTASLDVTVTE